MSEQYQNLAVSTITGTIDATTNPYTIVVAAGTGSLFPSTTNGPFRVTVSDATGTNAEVFLVTNRSTDTMTAYRGTGIAAYAAAEIPIPTLSTHSAGSIISHNLTSGAMNQIRRDSCNFGTLAGEPGTSTASTGDLYFASDSFRMDQMQTVGYQSYIMVPVVPPPLTGWTLMNQGSATVSTTGNVITLSDANNGGLSCYLMPVPTPPYKIWARLLFQACANDDAKFGGLMWTNGTTTTANGIMWGVRSNGWCLGYTISNLSSPSFNVLVGNDGQNLDSQPLSGVSIANLGGVNIGLEDDGTNFHLTSVLEGVGTGTSVSYYSATNTTFITPTYVGIFVRSNGQTTPAYLSLLSWNTSGING